MTRSRPITFLASAAVIPLAALAVAACGGGGAAATASPPPKITTTPAPSKTPSAQSALVRVAGSRLGKILVDSQGRTLYLFKADSGTKSACAGACAVAWPPLRTGGKPTAGSGATASLVGSTPRSDGAAQVTYNGHPLYLFVKDHKPGDVNGQGVDAFGAAWFVVSRGGHQISSKPSGHHSTSASSHPAAPAAPPAAKPQPAPQPAPPAAKPAPPAAKPAPPAAKPAPPAAKPAPPAAKPAPPANSGIPQNNGGDGDADNNGGPSDGDGNV